MTGPEQIAVLRSMTIIHDTREQNTERARKRYASFGVPTEKGVLDYGDYTWNAVLPDGSSVYDISERIFPRVAVERKMNLDELAGCFTHDRKRFEAEMLRAQEHGCRVFLLCENSNMENLFNGKYRSRLNPKAFVASVFAWMVRYDLEVIFCKEETSGKVIKEILYRDLKERLQNGEFDET